MIATDPNVQAAILDRTLRTTAKEEGGNLLVNTYQDVGPHLEYAAKLRREEWERRGHFGKRGEFRQTMSIPSNLFPATAKMLGIPIAQMYESHNMKRIMKELKRPEFKYFRTTSDKRI